MYTKKQLEESRVDFNQLYTYFNQFLHQPDHAALLQQCLGLQKENNLDSLKSVILSKKDEMEKEYNIDFDLPLTDLQMQKYTTVGGVPHLDGAYTVFGQVIDGLDVIDKIAAVKTDAHDRPLEDVVLTVTVKEMPRKKITKLYGYQYPDNKN